MKNYGHLMLSFVIAVAASAINSMEKPDIFAKGEKALNRAESICGLLSSRLIGQIPGEKCGFLSIGQQKIQDVKTAYSMLSQDDKTEGKKFAKDLLQTEAGKNLKVPSFQCNYVPKQKGFECKLDEKQEDQFIRNSAQIIHGFTGFFSVCVKDPNQTTSHCSAKTMYMIQKFEKNWRKNNS